MKLDPDLIAKLVVDITDTLPGLAKEDRVFRTANGYVVKVKCLLHRDDGWHGAHVAQVALSGSICGEDGKALRRDAGGPAVWALGQGHTFKAEGDDDPLAELQVSRIRCVAQTIRAEKAYRLMHDHIEGGLPGLAAKPSFTASQPGKEPAQ